MEEKNQSMIGTCSLYKIIEVKDWVPYHVLLKRVINTINTAFPNPHLSMGKVDCGS